MSRQALAVAALLLLVTLFPLATDPSPAPDGRLRLPVAAAAANATVTPTPTASPFPSPTPTVTVTPTATPPPYDPYTPTPTPTPVRAFPFAVQPVSPARNATLPGVGPLSLRWNPPPGITQYQLQVLPGSGDGPGLNLVRDAESSYTVPAPVLGEGPYILLPGMRYIWRVRATDKADFAPENDPAWGPWSEFWAFQTPPPSLAGLAAVTPPDQSALSASATQLVWRNGAPDVFYYELQVSGDTRFDPNPGTATSFVWWNLVHSGVTDPPNSWRTPPLQPAATYYWRVRPRVQGGGVPVAWGPVWSFTTAAALATATPTASATPTPAPPARIAFASNRDHNTEIYVARVDGSSTTRLTSNENVDDWPVWSPDGTKIAYWGNGEQWVIKADGSEQRKIAGSVTGKASWSPDSKWLAFVSGRDLYRATVNGSDLIRMTNTFPGENDGDVRETAWSPDGTKIAFLALKGEERNLYVINPDRTGLTLLAMEVEGQLSWSSDSNRVAFVSLENGNQDIFTIAVRDRSLRRLTTSLYDDFAPAWSPDGTQITFVSTRDFNPEIYVMQADGSGQKRLTTSGPPDEQPGWSRDGKQIAFVSGRDGNSEVYIMQADGSGVRNVTHNASADARPDWAPP